MNNLVSFILEGECEKRTGIIEYYKRTIVPPKTYIINGKNISKVSIKNIKRKNNSNRHIYQSKAITKNEFFLSFNIIYFTRISELIPIIYNMLYDRLYLKDSRYIYENKKIGIKLYKYNPWL